MNRNTLIAIVVAVVGLGLALATFVKVGTFLVDREYTAPIASEAPEEGVPRQEALSELAKEAEAEAQARPYEEVEYREFPLVGSRVLVWSIAQLHLLFAAFVLAVPIFALIIEAIGYFTGDERYDKLAYEFTKLLSVSFSMTATFGAFLTFMLIILYPKFTNYLMHIFSPTFLPYVGLFFFEVLFLYTYYYGWGNFTRSSTSVSVSA